MENVIIIGSGCAGLTAALYTARANLNPLVITGRMQGGLLTTTTIVENYPGFVEGIDGYQLMMNMQQQAERFGARIRSLATVESVELGAQPFAVTVDGERIEIEWVRIQHHLANAKRGGLDADAVAPSFSWHVMQLESVLPKADGLARASGNQGRGQRE